MIERDERSLMTPARALRVHSLAGRVAEYFTRNPDEILTVADIATKFDVRRCDVQARLREHVLAGTFAVENERGSGPVPWNTAPTTYSAGQRLLADLCAINTGKP